MRLPKSPRPPLARHMILFFVSNTCFDDYADVRMQEDPIRYFEISNCGERTRTPSIIHQAERQGKIPKGALRFDAGAYRKRNVGSGDIITGSCSKVLKGPSCFPIFLYMSTATMTNASPRKISYPSTLSNLTSNDKALFYRYGIGPARPVQTPIIHHAFEYHARNQPDSIAVEHLLFNHSLTYGQLDVQANRLAGRLCALGIVPGKRICILARRSTYLIVAILAVLKSGAQYVPLDAVTITDATLDYVLQDSEPSVVLVMDEFAHRVQLDVPTLTLEDTILADEISNADAIKPDDTTSPSDGAYVIYTSGTTGVPKGVNVNHRGVTNGIASTLFTFIYFLIF